MGQPKLDTCMWDLIDSNVELFMLLVKGDRFGTCRPNVNFFFFKFNVFYSRIILICNFVEYPRHLRSDKKKKKKKRIKENRTKTTS